MTGPAANLKAVRVHGGGALVKGAAAKWTYHVATLFTTRRTADGRWIWTNSGYHTEPRRSLAMAAGDGQALARDCGATFMQGYGSLHCKPVVLDEPKENT